MRLEISAGLLSGLRSASETANAPLLPFKLARGTTVSSANAEGAKFPARKAVSSRNGKYARKNKYRIRLPVGNRLSFRSGRWRSRGNRGGIGPPAADVIIPQGLWIANIALVVFR